LGYQLSQFIQKYIRNRSKSATPTPLKELTFKETTFKESWTVLGFSLLFQMSDLKFLGKTQTLETMPSMQYLSNERDAEHFENLIDLDNKLEALILQGIQVLDFR
jgi:hypothetical protein